jgi:hypothetical protein
MINETCYFIDVRNPGNRGTDEGGNYPKCVALLTKRRRKRRKKKRKRRKEKKKKNSGNCI